MRKLRIRLSIILLITIGGSLCAAPTPMGTAFNYQGYLTDKNGKALDNEYDLQFELYNDSTGGQKFGPTVTHAPIQVNKGLFSTNIDFGPVFDGKAYWLQIGVRLYGSQNNYDLQSPRQQIRPVPNALFAHTASNTAPDSVSGTSIQNNSITANKIANGQVVKSLNGLFDNVSLQVTAPLSLAQNGNTLTLSSSGGASGWSLTGNAGTTPGVNFLGTTDNQPLELKTFGLRALSLKSVSRSDSFSTERSINLSGGSDYNYISAGVLGGTVGGGGGWSDFGQFATYYPNRVTGDYGTVSGGGDNVAGYYATVPGGNGNNASGQYSFAAGKGANATHDGSFVWGDGTQTTSSTGPNQFFIRASGGVFLSPEASLYWGNSRLAPDQGGAIELGNSLGNGSTPYIDFHFGVGSDQDYNVRLINDGDGRLYCDGNLHVAGDTSVRTLTIRGGADLAEPFQMSHANIPKGSVVIIDEQNPGQLKMSDQPYDSRVAGIVSGAGGINTGLSLRQEGKLDSGQNVALTGRVYVLADAGNGAITPGDLLTTSSTPGHAMKVTEHARAQGAILGKAMSGLNEGKGLVLVLVTLQ